MFSKSLRTLAPILFLTLVLWWVTPSLVSQVRTLGWTQVDCKGDSSKYTYEAGKLRFYGERVAFVPVGMAGWSTYQEWFSSARAKAQVCYYNPESPSDSTLYRGFAPLHWITLVLALSATGYLVLFVKSAPALLLAKDVVEEFYKIHKTETQFSLRLGTPMESAPLSCAGCMSFPVGGGVLLFGPGSNWSLLGLAAIAAVAVGASLLPNQAAGEKAWINLDATTGTVEFSDKAGQLQKLALSDCRQFELRPWEGPGPVRSELWIQSGEDSLQTVFDLDDDKSRAVLLRLNQELNRLQALLKGQ